MEQPQRGSKSFQPIQQSRSAGHLGPYDGHGKRGRNLIARIKGLSESSSSSPDDDDVDEDELTNARITKSRVRKDKGNYNLQFTDVILSPLKSDCHPGFLCRHTGLSGPFYMISFSFHIGFVSYRIGLLFTRYWGHAFVFS